MPPVSPADMPEQSLKHFRRRGVRTPVNPKGVHSPAWRRLLVLGSAVALSCWGIYEMYSVLALGELIFVENLVLVLFALTFSWITVAFAGSIIGFFKVIAQHKPLDEEPVALTKRTAVLMPTYNEQPGRIFSAIETMAKAIQAQGEGAAFDWFVLSDTTDVEVAIAEEVALQTLRHRLGSEVNVYYRRRVKNEAKKAGNVADFCKRWGGAYDHLLVLDADSLMEAKTMITLARRMEADPDAGLIQTIPQLINGTTLMARIQQFATRVYGPVVGSGLAWWTAKEGNFWGHNAIIRTEAFMSAAGLPQLRGKPPFGGHILSHDFVEAALMGRGGYEVWLEPELINSHEESPPTLVDDLQRDKRWAKGNLQHLWVMLFESGLRPAHRMAFLNGIMSYLASPLWLVFLILTTIEAARLVLVPIDYFPEPHSLFPVWPEWNPAWAIGLAGSTLFLLFLPKILAVIDVMRCRRINHHGGMIHLFFSVIGEILVSSLLAPIRMLAHSRYVLESLFNVTLRWAGQNRTDETRWSTAILHQFPGTLLAGCWAAFAFWLDHLFFFWSLPVAGPLVFAAPTSVFLSRVALGDHLKHWSLFQVRQEPHGSPLLDDLSATSGPLLDIRRGSSSAVVQAILDPVLNQVHQALAHAHRGGKKQEMILGLRQQCFHQGPEALDQQELSYLVRDRASLQWLHEQAWRASPDSCWGKALQRHCQPSWVSIAP